MTCTQLVNILKPSSSKLSSDEDSGCLSEGAVIVYVWRQRDTEVIAENLVASGVSGGVVVYHGGMNADGRRKAQSKVRQILCSDCFTVNCTITYYSRVNTVHEGESQNMCCNRRVWSWD